MHALLMVAEQVPIRTELEEKVKFQKMLVQCLETRLITKIVVWDTILTMYEV